MAKLKKTKGISDSLDTVLLQKGMTFEESRELWNLINSRKNSLLDELRSIESVLGVIEKRTNLKK